MITKKETVRLLCKSIMTKLENRKAIAFAPQLRQTINDEIYETLKPHVFTDEHLHERALEKMGSRADALEETHLAESDKYKTAKAIARGEFGDDVLNGLYFQKPLKTLAGMVSHYLMRSHHIEEVYDTDEEIERQIVDIVKKFNPAELH